MNFAQAMDNVSSKEDNEDSSLPLERTPYFVQGPLKMHVNHRTNESNKRNYVDQDGQNHINQIIPTRNFRAQKYKVFVCSSL